MFPWVFQTDRYDNCYTYITGVAVIIHTCTSVQDGCARFFLIGL
jgi:hypothetical protein